MFGKDQTRLKGLRSGVVGLLWRTLTKRAKETKSLIVLSIDGYNTSKVCSRCGEKDMKVAPKTKGVGVLQCSKCEIIWNRDLNAAKNMRIISNAIWSGNERPQIYKPKKKSVVNPSA
jgi:transposase